MTKPAILSPALVLVLVGKHENGQVSSTTASAELCGVGHTVGLRATCSLRECCWPPLPAQGWAEPEMLTARKGTTSFSFSWASWEFGQLPLETGLGIEFFFCSLVLRTEDQDLEFT